MSMYNELYPAPQVNWYPGAQALQLTNPSGLSYPEPASAAGGSFTGGGAGSFAAAPGGGPNGVCPGSFEPGGASFTGLGGGAMSEYARSEYGRPVGGGPDFMSFYTIAAAQGFPRRQSGSTKTSAENGYLVVNVDSALDLTPSDQFGAHHYYATAGYPGESEEEMEERRTVAVKANPSPTNPQKENCVLHKRIMVPYNSRQQFVMVSIFEADQLGDTFIGKATVPLAEQKLVSTSPWPLIRDSNPNGTLTLNIQVPNGDTMGANSGPRGGSWSAQPADLPPPQSSASFTVSGAGNAPPTSISAAGHGFATCATRAPVPNDAVDPLSRTGLSRQRQDPPFPQQQQQPQELMHVQPQTQQHIPPTQHMQQMPNPMETQPQMSHSVQTQQLPTQPQLHAHMQPAPCPVVAPPTTPPASASNPYGPRPPMPAGLAPTGMSHLPVGAGSSPDPLGASQARAPSGGAGYPAPTGRPLSLMSDAGFAAEVAMGSAMGAYPARPSSYIPPPSQPSACGAGEALFAQAARSWIPAPVAATPASSVMPSAAVSNAGLASYLGAPTPAAASLSMGPGAGSTPGMYSTSMAPSLTPPPAHAQYTPMTSMSSAPMSSKSSPGYHQVSGAGQPTRHVAASMGGLGAPVVTTHSSSIAAQFAATPSAGVPMRCPAAVPAGGPAGLVTAPRPGAYYPSASLASPLSAYAQPVACGSALHHPAGPYRLR